MEAVLEAHEEAVLEAREEAMLEASSEPCFSGLWSKKW